MWQQPVVPQPLYLQADLRYDPERSYAFPDERVHVKYKGEENWVALPDTSFTYQAAKHDIARKLHEVFNHASKSRNAQDGKRRRMLHLKQMRRHPNCKHITPYKKYNPLASRILKMLLFEGIVYRKVIFPLQRWRSYPTQGNILPTLEIWKKDPIYRAIAMNYVGTNRWCSTDDFHDYILSAEKNLLDKTSKVVKRAMLNKRIPVSLVLRNTNFWMTYKSCGTDKIGKYRFLELPAWAYSSQKNYEKYLHALPLMKKFTRKDAMKLSRVQGDCVNHCFELMRLGIITRLPKTVDEWLDINKRIHDHGDPVYRALYDNVKLECFLEIDWPELPDIGAIGCQIWTAQDLRKEGDDMHHCVGLYVGSESLFMHIRRGNDKVTLQIMKNGPMYQCYGRSNSVTPLSKDVLDHWYPILKPSVERGRVIRESNTKPMKPLF